MEKQIVVASQGRAGQELKTPSLSDMARNMAQSAAAVLKSRKEPAFVSTAEHEERIKHCQSCGFLTTSGQCGNTEEDARGCGCFMKLKSRIAAVRCPRNFW